MSEPLPPGSWHLPGDADARELAQARLVAYWLARATGAGLGALAFLSIEVFQIVGLREHAEHHLLEHLAKTFACLLLVLGFGAYTIYCLRQWRDVRRSGVATNTLF